MNRPTDYMFGYGSLINADSRARTGKTGEAYPVRITGIRRAWNCVSPVNPRTVVGVIKDTDAACNGVIVPVSSDELLNFDKREGNYTREGVNTTDIKSLSLDVVPSGNIWVYVVRKPGKPTEDKPILQSYVDVIIGACLDFGEDFAREFISSTGGWDRPWINDRSNPQYQRAMEEIHERAHIDNILKDMLPNAFPVRA